MITDNDGDIHPFAEMGLTGEQYNSILRRTLGSEFHRGYHRRC